jgi:signal transduction histidine kinase
VTGPRRRRYDEADLALAEELARRCALAIDNARLYGELQAALRARDEFLSVAAHELRGPVTGLRGYAQLVMRQLARSGEVDSGRIASAMEHIDGQSRRLTDLVSRLLDLTKIETGQLMLDVKSADLTAVAQRTVDSMLAGFPERTVSVRAPDQIVAVFDEVRIGQVLTNLIDNAFKFSPAPAPVEVEVAAVDGGAVLAVRDHGPGVPEAERERIFGRHQQLDEGRMSGGLGLGLYVSREIVRHHGGTILVEGPDDGGARFVVRLPTEVPAGV